VRHDFAFSFHQFMESFPGLTLSPGRGLLVYTPVTLIAFAGVISRRRRVLSDTSFSLLFLSTIFQYMLYSFYTFWGGGWSFGPRFLVDVMPVWMMAAGVTVERCMETSGRRESPLANWSLRAFVLLGMIGIANQIAGAFGANGTY